MYKKTYRYLIIFPINLELKLKMQSPYLSLLNQI
jgi:hypothetical protein